MREADLTTFMCRMSCQSGSLNLLEPSGPHRACYGTPLSFKSIQRIVLIISSEIPVVCDDDKLTKAPKCPLKMY